MMELTKGMSSTYMSTWRDDHERLLCRSGYAQDSVMVPVCVSAQEKT